MALSATHNDQVFKIGDMVRVHQRIQEDNKTRTQVFEGTLIAVRGTGINKMFTVRRLGANSVAIERIFPLESPFVERIEVKAAGSVRRAKLYYIREKTSREIADITKRKARGHQASK
jgi:large subunit ribosomal protein L19